MRELFIQDLNFTEAVAIAVCATYLAAVFLAVIVIDARDLVIPNFLNLANASGGLFFATWTGTLPSSLAGAFLGLGTMLAVRLGYRLLRGREGLGFGDVKFVTGAGLWVGWEGVAPLLFLASLSALIFVSMRRLATGSFDPALRLPFGPFLCFATASVWLLQCFSLAPRGFSPWM